MPPTTDDANRHDFKNQLGNILGFSEILLAEAAADEPRHGDLEDIHKAATAALDLLARLYPDKADTPQWRLWQSVGLRLGWPWQDKGTTRD